MTIHRRARLTLVQRQEIFEKYRKGTRICDLTRQYSVSRPTIYKIVHRGKHRDFTIHRSMNARYRCLQYGLKRLAKVEAGLEKKLKHEAQRYNKSYPGEMLHADTVWMPLIEGESAFAQRERLYVAVDDFSRELYATILPDKTQDSSAHFLEQVLDECPYTIEQWYTDHGREWEGNPKTHASMRLCRKNGIERRFTKVKTPRTNGKAERMIRTVKQMWLRKTKFTSRAHRKQELIRFVNWYNTVKPHTYIKESII